MSKIAVVKLSSSKPELWENVLEKSKNGNLEQTIEYGEMKKLAYPRTRTIRLIALEDNQPLGVVQGYYRKRHGYGRFLTVGGVYGNGPVTIFKDEKPRLSLTKRLLEDLEKNAAKKLVIDAFLCWPERWGALPILLELGYKVISTFNVYIVDLEPKNVAWDRIASNKRKNIRQAEKQGVIVKDGVKEQDFTSFVKMLEASASRANFDPAMEEIKALWKLFQTKGLARIFLAEWRSKDVAGVFAITHGDTVYARAAGSYPWAWKARPNDLLHRKAMEWGSEKGFTKYHMGLVPAPPPTQGSPIWGLWRWKREWKGRLEKMLFLSKDYMPRAAKFIKVANRFLHPLRKSTE